MEDLNPLDNSLEIKSLISQTSPVEQRLIFANLAHEEPYKLYIKLNKQEKDCA